jgi:hypothetical protein
MVNYMLMVSPKAYVIPEELINVFDIAVIKPPVLASCISLFIKKLYHL